MRRLFGRSIRSFRGKFSAIEDKDDDEHKDEARFNIDNYFFKFATKGLRFFARSAAKKWPPLEAAEVIICAAAPAPGKASDLNLGELCVLLCGPGFCGCR